MSMASFQFWLSQSSLFQAARDLTIRWRVRDSYAQHGEDRFILDTVFGGRQNGTYVDIGASHPVRISNTWLLYRNGWTGITVEPIERLSRLHRRWRPRDTQVKALMGGEDGELDFYSMYPSVLSTCSVSQYDTLVRDGHRLVEHVVLPQLTFSTLLSRYGTGQPVDFISVDIEGLDRLIAAQVARLDRAVLPRCFCIECVDDDASQEIAGLLTPLYAHCRRLGPNLIFWN